ncbi:hypothetical protein EAE96_002965 [Botrytis aclada]|nr:hypothetical protein EAE96_002965 [Botrytis aclada]
MKGFAVAAAITSLARGMTGKIQDAGCRHPMQEESDEERMFEEEYRWNTTLDHSILEWRDQRGHSASKNGTSEMEMEVTSGLMAEKSKVATGYLN